MVFEPSIGARFAEPMPLISGKTLLLPIRERSFEQAAPVALVDIIGSHGVNRDSTPAAGDARRRSWLLG